MLYSCIHMATVGVNGLTIINTTILLPFLAMTGAGHTVNLDVRLAAKEVQLL